MIVLGVDPGLTQRNPTGLAVVDTHGPTLLSSMVIPVVKNAPWSRQLTMIAEAVAIVISTSPGIQGAAYEYPHVRRNRQGEVLNPQVPIKLAHVGGVVITICSMQNIPCCHVQPAEAKMALTGNGAAGKPEMTRVARSIFGRPGLTKDEADACGVALAGEVILFQREILNGS